MAGLVCSHPTSRPREASHPQPVGRGACQCPILSSATMDPVHPLLQQLSSARALHHHHLPLWAHSPLPPPLPSFTLSGLPSPPPSPSRPWCPIQPLPPHFSPTWCWDWGWQGVRVPGPRQRGPGQWRVTEAGTWHCGSSSSGCSVG